MAAKPPEAETGTSRPKAGLKAILESRGLEDVLVVDLMNEDIREEVVKLDQQLEFTKMEEMHQAETLFDVEESDPNRTASQAERDHMRDMEALRAHHQASNANKAKEKGINPDSVPILEPKQKQQGTELKGVSFSSKPSVIPVRNPAPSNVEDTRNVNEKQSGKNSANMSSKTAQTVAQPPPVCENALKSTGKLLNAQANRNPGPQPSGWTQNAPQKNFASLFSGDVSSNGNVFGGLPEVIIADKTTKTHRGKPAIRFGNEETKQLTVIEDYLLIGKFSWGRPPLDEIRRFFAAKFILKGSLVIGWLDQRHVTLAFTQEVDCLNFLMKDQIMVADRFPMRIFRWTVGFTSERETSLASVWIRLPKLSAHLFNTNALRQVCKPVGKFLASDNATLNFTRPSYARVRVEIDLLAPRIDEIFIGFSEDIGKEDMGYFQKIEYERVPGYCTNCYKQGHTVEFCRSGVMAGGPSRNWSSFRHDIGMERGRQSAKGIVEGKRTRSVSRNREGVEKQASDREGEKEAAEIHPGIGDLGASTSGTKKDENVQQNVQEGIYDTVREGAGRGRGGSVRGRGGRNANNYGGGRGQFRKQNTGVVIREPCEGEPVVEKETTQYGKGKEKEAERVQVVEGGGFNALYDVDEEGNQIKPEEIDPGPELVPGQDKAAHKDDVSDELSDVRDSSEEQE